MNATAPIPPSASLPAELAARLVRHADLRPCTTAFIDARTPGSDRKENFTIIGPGVAENPDQHVHIREPHGFNIGGARQPPHCLNSQHSHETAEVFVVLSGTWRFTTGARKEGGWVILEPGDTISIPTQIFRGFENVGADTGFLYAVLGGDDPGRVSWAPDVIERAAGHGLVLLESGRLVDTHKGEAVPADDPPVKPMTPEEMTRFRSVTNEEIAACVVRRPAVRPSPASPLAGPGVSEAPIIGPASPAEGLPAGPLSWLHGFHLRRLDLEPGASVRPHRRQEEEVLFVTEGRLRVTLEGGVVEMGPGDTFTVPKGARREFANPGAWRAEMFVTRGGDAPAAPTWG
ncbi:MAG TPA: cupin domain-containing protein [Azospirillaceae bacterium]|nr:cupin domain-containing protein [Azospirillaceae bacterium]